MAEGSDAETEKGNLENDLKKVICQLRMFLMMYDPNKYEVAILVANKDEWIKKVENGQFTVLEVLLQVQDSKLLSAADKENLAKRTENIQTEVVEYITKFNKKILTNNAADVKLQFPDSTDKIFLVETKSVELPGAGIIAEIILEDAGVDNQKAAFVQIELQCIDVVMSNGSVEN